MDPLFAVERSRLVAALATLERAQAPSEPVALPAESRSSPAARWAAAPRRQAVCPAQAMDPLFAVEQSRLAAALASLERVQAPPETLSSEQRGRRAAAVSALVTSSGRLPGIQRPGIQADSRSPSAARS
jgi:hypothetical protein